MKLTAADIERDLELAAKATPGPWMKRVDSYPNRVWSKGMQVAMCGHAGFDGDNAELIARARTALPDYASDLREAMVARRRLHGFWCVICSAKKVAQEHGLEVDFPKCEEHEAERAFFGESHK